MALPCTEPHQRRSELSCDDDLDSVHDSSDTCDAYHMFVPLFDGVASIDLLAARCDWTCNGFTRLERAARAVNDDAPTTFPCPLRQLFSGAGWSFEKNDSEAQRLRHTLADPSDLLASQVGFAFDVSQLRLAAANGTQERYFRARVRKSSATRAHLTLTEVTEVVARGALGASRAAEARAKHDAQQREAHVRSFVFHEIGNLSTGLFGVLDELRECARKRQVPTTDSLESFDTLLTSMRDVLHNMMGFTQLSKASTFDDVATERFNLDHLFNELATLVQPRARVPIVVAPLCSDVHVVASKFYLKQVLYNLLGNAAKFTNAGQITLRAARKAGTLTLSVQDTGRGIPEDKIAKLYTFGEQTNASDATKGYGIGLTLVWTMLKQVFRTEPRVTSTVGVGTRLSFTIAVGSDNDGVAAGGDASAAAPVAAPEPLFSGDDSAPRRGLIVDDLQLNRRVLRARLTRALPVTWSIDEAVNGEEALRRSRDTPYDLVVMDYSMESSGGQLTGAETAEKILALRPDTRIVGCTGGSSGWAQGVESTEKAKMLAAGCRMVWPKPPPDESDMRNVLFGDDLELDGAGAGGAGGASAMPRLGLDRSTTRTVLIVEDNEFARRTLMRTLQALIPATWSIVTAQHGEEALEVGIGAQLCFVDFHLTTTGGKINGAETARQLIARDPTTVCVGVTANGHVGEAERELMLEGGCAWVFLKPCYPAALESLLFGDDSIDPASMMDDENDNIVFDYARARSLHGTNYDSVATDFKAEAEGLACTLRDTMGELLARDGEQSALTCSLKQVAHSLKGVALSFACSKLANCAAQLQDAASGDSANISQLAPLAESTCSSTLEVIAHIEATCGTTAPEEELPLSVLSGVTEDSGCAQSEASSHVPKPKRRPRAQAMSALGLPKASAKPVSLKAYVPTYPTETPPERSVSVCVDALSLASMVQAAVPVPPPSRATIPGGTTGAASPLMSISRRSLKLPSSKKSLPVGLPVLQPVLQQNSTSDSPDTPWRLLGVVPQQQPTAPRSRRHRAVSTSVVPLEPPAVSRDSRKEFEPSSPTTIVYPPVVVCSEDATDDVVEEGVTPATGAGAEPAPAAAAAAVAIAAAAVAAAAVDGARALPPLLSAQHLTPLSSNDAAATCTTTSVGVPATDESSARELLLVEDSPFQLKAASALLSAAGVAHVCARDGTEAVELVNASTPARFWAVLMDKEMPGMDGITATRAIRTLRPTLLIIGITADSGSAEAEFRGAGAQGILAKPLKPADITALATTHDTGLPAH